MTVDVSIIVVAWNVRKLVYECLKSVYDQTKGIYFEVIYVDNGSTDNTVDMLRKEFPDVRIIENEVNQGFIKANNQGIEIAEGRYVLLLNSDTVVLDDAIARTVRFADAHPQAAVIGCKVLNPDRTLQRTCFMYPSLLNMLLFATYLYKIFPRSKYFGRERMTWWDFDSVREVETVCGCFSLVRKKAIEQVGPMDSTYFVYGDDPDWCYRFKKNGWKIMFTPEPEVIHYGGQTTKQRADKFKLQLYGSRLIFMKKYGNKLTFPLACFLTALFFFLRVPYWVAVAVFAKNEKNNPLQTAKTYLKAGFYCIVDWKNLLMNKETVGRRL